MKIESLQNEKVKKWIKLKEKKYRDKESLFLIEDEHIVSEALKKNKVKELLCLQEITTTIPTFEVTEEIMKKITSQVTIPKIIGVCEKMKPQEIEGTVLFLDGIQDPGNLGTILRSATAFSIPNIVLNEKCVDLYNPKVIRSTEGIFFDLNIAREDTREILKKLKGKGYKIIGTDVSKGKLLEDLEYQENTVFIIGNEGNGMSEEARSFCEELICIPMNEKCESLNASVSASIIMYEVQKRRKK